MKKLRQIWGFVFVILLFSSCVKEVTNYEEDIPVGDIVLKKEVPQRISEDMIVEVKDISDTRCPIGSVCNGSGNVCVGFQVYINEEFLDIEIDYNNVNDKCEATLLDHKIQIIEVEPKPFEGAEIINPLDYRIVINVEKL